MANLKFRVLGPFEVIGPAGSIPMASARQRTILALLVLDYGVTVSSDRLIDDVWGEQPPASARHALAVYVGSLRRVIGRDLIETAPRGYRLRVDAGEIDYVRFEALAHEADAALDAGDPAGAADRYGRALEIWRGPALADLAAEHVAVAARARLDDRRSRVIEQWLDAGLAAGRHADLVPALRRLAASDPLRESIRTRLMIALYRSGRQAEALDVYRQAREVLDRELGVEPGPELESAQRAVLAHDPDLLLPGSNRLAVGGARPEDVNTPEEGGARVIEDARATGLPTRTSGRAGTYENVIGAGDSAHSTRRSVTALVVEISAPRTGHAVDPESSIRPSGAVFKELRTIATRHGGTVQPFVDDTLLAIFGFPVIHEDDALRATRAASEMAQAVTVRPDIASSAAVRVGLSTGEIVTSHATGPPTFVGDVAMLAAGLARAAGSGEIMLGETTYRLIRHAAEASLVRSVEVWGRSDPISAYRLDAFEPGMRAHQLRFDSPLVGRERELRLLRGALEQTIEDEACYLFSLLGPAGVGKSRLVHEFLGSVRSDALVLRGRCLPYGEQVAFWPIAEVVKQAAQIRDSDDTLVARQKIERLLVDDDRAPLVAERVAGAIGLSLAPAAGDDSAWAIRSLFERLARDRPLVVVFDDVQWGEAALLDLVEHLADAVRDAPILLLCIARPELLDERPGWGGGKLNSSSVLVQPLSKADAARLVTNLLDGAGVSPEVERKIGEATEGNPLFVEEFLASLVENGTLRREGTGWVSAADLSSIVAPGSIMALLATRLDRLPPVERDLIGRASVVGKVFTRAALGAIAEGLDPTDVDAAISSLVRREVIRNDRSDAATADAYRFKHILIRDAAYAGVPKRDRIVIHELLAKWLDGRGKVSGLDDELIGAHFEQAYRYRTELRPVDVEARTIGRLAALRLSDAGRHAHVRGDARAAEDLLKRATALLPFQDPDRLALLIDLTETLIDRGEFAAAFEANDEVIEHAGPLGLADVRWRGVLQRFRLNFYTGRGQDPEARREANAAIRFFGEIDNDEAIGMAWRVIGELDNEAGHLAKSRRAYRRAADHSRRAGDLRGEAVARAVIGGIDLFGPATVGAAIQTAHSLLDWGRSTGQLATESIALAQLGRLRAMVGEIDESRRLVHAAIDIAHDLGRRLNDADSSRWIGLVEWLAGDPVAAESGFRRGYEELARLGETRLTAYVGAQLARMLYLQERLDEADAFTHLAEAQQSSLDVETGIIWRSIRGLVLARRGEMDAALALASEAVTIAESTDLLLARGLALADVAEVLALSGRRGEASAFFAKAIALFEQKGITVLADRVRATSLSLAP